MNNDFESIAPILFLRQDGVYIDSPVPDDQSLFLKTQKGLLIISGCAHRGIVNTIQLAQKLCKTEKIYMVIGGIHLLNTSRRQQNMTLDFFKSLDIEKIGVSHCTGMKAAGFLAQNLGFDKFFYNNAGTSISFEKGECIIKSFEKY